MVQKVVAFKTSDGKEFTNEVEANGHELALTIKRSVGSYCAAADLGAAEATRALKYISGYQAFMEDYTPPTADELAAMDAADAAAAAQAKAEKKAAKAAKAPATAAAQ